ncbi:cyclic peptide export ABC transporter (plasmid) [Burkholderia gladioli]|uniref:cyclic peptide export ABC transporter n=1 Tax=Burkholderia gladioli TaxID=28095 RepID=UPI001936C1E4|nr:cyclic peptide export ABC transporter [Burkholderia gladioli]QPQ89127.1 cyclic peptide export ABC transporter [Burkholderia gladioli]
MLREFLLKYRFSLLAATILSIAGAAVTLALLAHVNTLASKGVARGDIKQLLVGLAWLVVMFSVTLSSQYLVAHLSGRLVAALRTQLAAQFIALDYESLANKKHLIFSVLIKDINSIAPLALLAPQLLYNVLLAALCSSYLAIISVRLFLILMTFLGVAATASFCLERFTRKLYDAMLKEDEMVFHLFRTIGDGKKELTLNKARSKHFVEELLTPSIERSRENMIRLHLYWGVNGAWSNALLYGAVLIVIYLGFTSLNLQLQTVVHFVIGGLFLVGPVNGIIAVGQQVGIGMGSLRHIEKIGLDLRALEGTSEVETSTGGEIQHLGWKTLRAVDVSYSYPSQEKGGSPHGVGPITLEIKRGEMLFFVGGNGSGKSTLLLLLCGLLRPSSGQIFVDEAPILDNLTEHRSRFTGVFGDFFLFSDVLNASGKHISDVVIRERLKEFGLDKQVEVSNGTVSRLALSTGQRKRLALLHCYAEDREIFFFDEWAADQDAAFREYFYCTLLPGLKSLGKTVIVISHDDRYYQIADRIIKLEAGLLANAVEEFVDLR